MLSSILASLLFAAIPVEWSVDTFRVKPFVYDCYHGETLDLAASMTAYGTPLDLAGKTAKLYWSTNATATAWWTTNATVAASGSLTNILAATFSGAYDTGADFTYGFIGVDGENYRAAFTLRFRPSPGFVPNKLNPPVTVLDFATVSVLNPESSPFVVKGGEGDVTLAQVTNVAGRVTSNVVTKAYVESLGIEAGVSAETVTNVAENVTSNIVPAWARSETPPESMTDNAVVLTNAILRTKGGEAIDYTTTNAAERISANSVTNNVATWAMAGKSAPITDLSPATNYVDSVITNTCPAFSNAVLTVGLGISTNEVASIKAMVDSFSDYPIGTGATTIGALLLALAGAVTWLKKHTVKTDGETTQSVSGELIVGDLSVVGGTKFAIVSSVPASPASDTLYFITGS